MRSPISILKKAKKKRASPTTHAAIKKAVPTSFPIVAIGASAGGLEASENALKLWVGGCGKFLAQCGRGFSAVFRSSEDFASAFFVGSRNAATLVANVSFDVILMRYAASGWSAPVILDVFVTGLCTYVMFGELKFVDVIKIV